MKLFILLALMLSSCATVYDLDNRMPDARYASAKSAPVLTQCIHGVMRGLGTTNVEQGAESTWITLTTQTGNPAARVTIRPTQTGSVVMVRQTIHYSLGRMIERCL